VNKALSTFLNGAERRAKKTEREKERNRYFLMDESA
jgi:hypothetical protein